MGTAFTAVADDISAIWYNPAGISRQRSSAVFEWSETPEVEAASSVISTDRIFGVDGVDRDFIGASEVTDFSNGNNQVFVALNYGGFGLYYYKPYEFDLPVNTFIENENGSRSLVSAKLLQDVEVFGFSLAFSVGKFSIGINPGLLRVKEEATIFVDGAEDDGDSKDKIDYAFSVGALWTLYEPSGRDWNPLNFSGWKYKLGAAYRSSRDTDYDFGLDRRANDKRDEILFKKPTTYDIGFAAETQFMLGEGILSVLTLSTQYGETDYENASNLLPLVYRKAAFGLNLGIKIPDRLIDQFDIRAGYYTNSISDDSGSAAAKIVDGLFPETSGFTLGLGVKISNLVLDVSAEWRELDSVIGRCASVRDQINGRFGGGVGDRVLNCGYERTPGFDDVFMTGSIRYLFGAD